MTLVEVAHVTNTKPVSGFTIKGEHVVSMEGLEVVKNGVLSGGVGFGRTELEARETLAEGLSWQTVTNGGTCRPRHEISLPGVVG